MDDCAHGSRALSNPADESVVAERFCHPRKEMTVNQKQLQRLKVIENAVEGKLTVLEASVLLGISPRQVKRYKAMRKCTIGFWAASCKSWASRRLPP